MIWVVCVLVLWVGDTKSVYPGARGQIMQWSEPNLSVDFSDYMREEGIASATYMQSVPSNSCTLVSKQNVEQFLGYKGAR